MRELCDYCSEEWTNQFMGMHFCTRHMQQFFLNFMGKKLRNVTNREEIDRLLRRVRDGKSS